MTTRTSDLATQAAEAVRELNHLTYQPGTLHVPDAYTVIAELTAMTYRMAQLLDQLAANLTSREEQGGLRLDANGVKRYATTAAAVGVGRAALADASAAARALGLVLAEAQSVTATFADPEPEE